MTVGEDEFVKRRIYLTLERGRDIALRNLLRKVFLAGGFEDSKDGGPPPRRTRVPVAEFGAAIRLGSKTQDRQLDNDEIECLLANMIYKVWPSVWQGELHPCLRHTLPSILASTDNDTDE